MMTKKATPPRPRAAGEGVRGPATQDAYDAFRDAKGKHRRPIAEIGDAEARELFLMGEG